MEDITGSKNIFMLDGKQCSTFCFNNCEYDIRGIKPHHVLCYCDCKCISMDENGFGVFELCEIHIRKAAWATPGEELIPEVIVTIPLNFTYKVLSYLQFFKREIKRKLR